MDRIIKCSKTCLLLVVALSLFQGCTTIKETCMGVVDFTKQTMGQIEESTQQMTTMGRQMAFSAPVMQFQALYASFFYLGGYMFSDKTYTAGEGTVWVMTSKDNKQEDFRIEKALLKINPDKSQWWKLKYSSGEDTMLYEALIETDYTLKKLRFRDPDTGEVKEYVPEQTQRAEKTEEVQSLSKQDYARYIKGKKTITVKAGTFKTDYIVIEQPGSNYRLEWWTSSKVPGGMVKYKGKDLNDDSEVLAELVKIGKGYTTELGSF